MEARAARRARVRPRVGRGSCRRRRPPSGDAPVTARPVMPAAAFIAADVGGTRARVAIATANPAGAITLDAYAEYRCAHYPGLAELLQAFLAAHGDGGTRACVLACSGQRVGEDIINPTLPWHVNLDVLRRLPGLDDVRCLNDFEALGYAVEAMQAGRLLFGPEPCPPGNALIIGPGTGLGVAFRVLAGGRSVVVASEAGQMAFAPGTAREGAVLQELGRGRDYVCWEDVVSGPGIARVYRALKALDAQPPALATPEAITAAARTPDAHARVAVGMFCAALGGVAGDLAMAMQCTGGVYLAGGILPEVADLLEQSAFQARFLGKGVMREFLARIPVRIVEHGRLGVIGAARWYLEQAIPA